MGGIVTSGLMGFGQSSLEYGRSAMKGLVALGEAADARDLTKWAKKGQQSFQDDLDIIDSHITNKYAAFGGNITSDLANAVPAGIITKGGKSLKNTLKSGVSGFGLGTATSAFRDYGNPNISKGEMINNALVSGTLWGGMNTVLASKTAGKLFSKMFQRSQARHQQISQSNSVDEIAKTSQQTSKEEMLFSKELNGGEEVAPEVAGTDLIVKLENTIQDNTYSLEQLYERLDNYNIKGEFRDKVIEAYRAKNSQILSEWMGAKVKQNTISNIIKTETDLTTIHRNEVTNKHNENSISLKNNSQEKNRGQEQEFNKALGDLGENELPPTQDGTATTKPNEDSINLKNARQEQSVGRENNSEIKKSQIKEFDEPLGNFHGQEAVAVLLQEQKGHVKDAFFRDDIGSITLPFGKVGTGQSDGWGLSKIAKFHPEVLDKLEDSVENLPIIKETEGRIKLADDKYFASIRKEFDGTKENWVLTAFEKKSDTATSRTDLSSTSAKAPDKTTSGSDDIIPQNQIKGESFVMNENSQAPYQYAQQNFQVEQWINDLSGVLSDEWTTNLKSLAVKHPEMFKSEADVFRVIKEIKDNPTHFFKNNKDENALIAKDFHNGKSAEVAIRKDDGTIVHTTINDAKRLAKLQGRNAELLGGNELVESSRVRRLPYHSHTSETMPTANAGSATDDIIPHPNENININNLKANDNINFHAKIFNPKTRKFDLVPINSKVIKTKDGFTYAVVKDKHGFTALDIKSGARIAAAKNANELSKTIDDFNAKWGKEYFEFSSKHTLDLDNAKRNNASPELIKQIDEEFIAIKDKYALTKDEWGNPTIKFADFLKKNGIEQNTIYVKGGDNLAAGLISGVEEDEDGNLSINPTKFIAGLGGYTVAKKLLQNPKVQQGFKNTIGEQIAKQKRTKDIINHIENSPRKGTNLPIVAPKDLSEAVLSYIKTNRRKITIQRVPEYLKESLAKKFGYKHVNDIRRTINGDDINHVLKRHGNADIELSRNQEAITLKDIQEYPNFVNNADIQSLRTTKNNAPAIISGKQINGHYVIVEEVQTKQNELAFKTMYKVKGKLSENKMFRQSEASHFRVIRTATTNPLSNNEILPNHPQKVNDQIQKITTEAQADTLIKNTQKSIKINGGIPEDAFDLVLSPIKSIQNKLLKTLDNFGKVKTEQVKARVSKITADEFANLTGVNPHNAKDGLYALNENSPLYKHFTNKNPDEFEIITRGGKREYFRVGLRDQYKNEGIISGIKSNYFDQISDEYMKHLHLKNAYEQNSLRRISSYQETLEKAFKDNKESKAFTLALDEPGFMDKLPEHLKENAKEFRKLIDERANLLEELGMLGPNEKIEHYVKRLYEEYATAVGFKEGLTKALFGKNTFGNFNTLSSQFKRKDLSLKQREELGQIFDASRVIPATLMLQEKQIQKAKFFKDISDDFASIEPLKGYVQVPNSYEFGLLKGKYIPHQMHYSLVKAPQYLSEIDRVYQKAFSHFKVNKTVKNPGTHFLVLLKALQYHKYILASPTGFEPVASKLGILRSILLSYGDKIVGVDTYLFHGYVYLCAVLVCVFFKICLICSFSLLVSK